MVQLLVLPLLWLLSCTLSVEPPPLFSEECCTEKTVGGVGYTQVAGDTDDFPECKKGCVYEEDGDKGSRFCFKSGNLKAECTEPLLDSSYVSVTRNNNDLIFKSDIGAFSCEITSDTPSSDNITCSKIADQETEGAEKAAFFYSKSNEDILWMCLHSKTINIHCDFICDKTTTAADCEPQCQKISTPAENDVLFVEGAEPAEGDGLFDQLNNCWQKCFDRSDLPDDDPKKCTFYTLSFWDDHEHEGRQARNHDTKSECGIRNYNPKRQLTTNPDQYAGFPDNKQEFIKGAVFVFEAFVTSNAMECTDRCIGTPDCRTWTWDLGNRLCSINVYTPTRKIDISGRRPKPNLISGCIEDVAKNWTCPTTANPTTTTTTTTTTITTTTTTTV